MIHPWSVLGVHWKDWCWSWNSNTLATWYKDLTHLKIPDAGKDWGQEEKGTAEDEMVGWHHHHGVWVSSASWWWTGRPGVLQSLRLQRVGHKWATELIPIHSLWNWVVIRSITLVHPSLPKFAPLKCHLSIGLSLLSERDHYCYLAYILHNKLRK